VPKKQKSIFKRVVIPVFIPLLIILFTRAFIFHAFVIPTPSMESSLMVGDMLIVNKTKYGIRLPNTPLSIPFLHNRLPGSNIKSYSSLIDLPTKTLFKGKGPKRNDVVVFHYPAYNHKQYGHQTSYVPIDKRDYYIKRCVAMPGDSLIIKNDSVFVNGGYSPYPINVKFNYLFEFAQGGVYENMFSNCGIDGNKVQLRSHIMQAFLTQKQAKCLAENKVDVKLIQKFTYDKNQPGNGLHPQYVANNICWYGPVYIPKKGETLSLSSSNIGWYKDVLVYHEKNELAFKDGKILINNQEVEAYTFKKDYYFMLGDSRHNSLDSRYWGFVPQDHIVGSPSIIINSTDEYGKFRKDRLFKTNFN